MELDPRKWQWVCWQDARNIPAKPGCYALIDANDNVLYIGRSKILWNRLRNPSNHPGFLRGSFDRKTIKIAWLEGWDAYDSERSLILKWEPSFCQERIARKG
jgi:hypothetical protein